MSSIDNYLECYFGRCFFFCKLVCHCNFVCHDKENVLICFDRFFIV